MRSSLARLATLPAVLAAMGGCGGRPVTARAEVRCNLPLAPDLLAPRIAWVEAELGSEVASFEKKFGAPGSFACPTPGSGSDAASVADFVSYGLAKLTLSPADPASAAAAVDGVRCAFSFQDYHPQAPTSTQGVIAFHVGDPPRLGDNGTEFALDGLGPLLLEHAAALPSELRGELEPRIQAALDQVEGHAVCSGYTNICLIQSQILMTLGQFLSGSADPAVRAYGAQRIASGEQRLSAWLAFTRTTGIAEYDSPTYYQVDVEALGLALRHAPDAATAALLRKALDYLFADMAASTFAGRGGLAGPFSRTYDFIEGRGPAEIALYLAGLREPVPEGEGVAMVRPLLVFGRDAPYVPSAAALCLSSAPLREVVSTWGSTAGDGKQRYLYVTPDFALGSTSASYGSLDSDQDVTVAADLGSSPDVPRISMIPDYLDAPGSSVKEGDFQKVTHLLAGPAAAQSRGALLALFKIPARDPRYRDASGNALPVVDLSSNVLFPAGLAGEELVVNGSAESLTAPMALPAGSTVTVRVGTGAVAVRLLEASGVLCPDGAGGLAEGAPASVVLSPYTAQRGSSKVQLARLAVLHLASPPADTSVLDPCFVRLSLIMLADRCAAAGCAQALGQRASAAGDGAQVAWSAASGDWSVRATIPGGAGPELYVERIARSDPAQDALGARLVNGSPMGFLPLGVNGQDLTLAP